MMLKMLGGLQGTRRRVIVALGSAAILCPILLLAWPRPSHILTRHFDGYRYTATTRLAVFTVTNRSSCAVEFMDPIKIYFSGGWLPGPCVVRDAVYLRSGCSA